MHLTFFRIIFKIVIRRVPFQTLLQKVPRIVRDVSGIKSKEIETIIQGETTLIDKSIIDENNKYIGLHVDGIEGLPKRHDFFQGGAVMGDGSVAMVINTEKLVEFTSNLENSYWKM